MEEYGRLTWMISRQYIYVSFKDFRQMLTDVWVSVKRRIGTEYNCSLSSLFIFLLHNPSVFTEI